MVAKDSEVKVHNKKVILIENVKNNFIEDDHKLVLTLYVKGVDAEKFGIKFDESKASISFRTNDENFLKSNQSDPSTEFECIVNLTNKIDTNRSYSTIAKTKIEIGLVKHSSSLIRWNSAFKRTLSVNNEEKTEPVKKLKEEESSAALTQEQISTSTKTKKINNDEVFKDIINKKPSSRSRSLSSSSSSSRSSSTNSSSSSILSFSNKINKVKLADNFAGYVGLKNLGNTCYMNAALQCLINSTDLRDYFLESRLIEKELNKKNALGLNGHLAIGFDSFLRRVWQSKKNVIAPIELRNLMCEKYAHFQGYEQHDTQEFMSSLLSILHEDLNRVLKKPFYENALECENESAQLTREIADESWKRFLSRENSVIVDNFYGQFKSKLTCLECGKVSITFEPFNNLLVPLPKEKREVKVILVHRLSKQKNPVQFESYFIETLTIEEILNDLKKFNNEFENSKFKVFSVQQRLIETNDGLSPSYEFSNDWSPLSYTFKISDLKEKNLLLIYEIEELDDSESMFEIQIQQVCKYPLLNNAEDECAYCKTRRDPQKQKNNLPRCTRCFRSSYCNSECQKKDWTKHSANICNMSFDSVGFPIYFSTSKNSSDFETTFKTKLIETAEFSIDGSNLNENDSFELFLNDEPNAKLNSLKKIQINEIKNLEKGSWKFLLKWNNKNVGKKEAVVKVSSDWSKLSVRASAGFGLWSENGALNLHDCLKLFTQPEKLNSENPWYCSRCKKHQEAMKEMNLWKLPKYLILSLKRFQTNKTQDCFSGDDQRLKYLNPNIRYFLQNRVTYSKINSKVEFPLRDLNLSDYLTPNSSKKSECVYDLYAIINHHGNSMSLGHYTAYARTPQRTNTVNDEIGWRLFDDERVLKIDKETQINMKDCYVLLYRQRENDDNDNVEQQAGKESSCDESEVKQTVVNEKENNENDVDYGDNDEFFSDNDSKESTESAEMSFYTDLNAMD